MADFFWFSDEQWSRIEPLLPSDTRSMPRVDGRRLLSGIVHALKSGGRWGDCPEHVYEPKKTLYNRLRRWADKGLWVRISADLAAVEGVPSTLFIDSSCIKIHRTAGGAKGGLGSWDRHDQRRSQHQAPRRLRRERPSPRPAPDAGKHARCQGRHAGDQCSATVTIRRGAHGLRQQCPATLAGRARHHTGHPVQVRPQYTDRARPGHLTPAQRYRAQHLDLHGHNRHRRHGHVVALMSPDPSSAV